MPRKAYKKCSIEGCSGNVIAKGLCDLHYRRQLRHGNVEKGRPVDWGTREKHPLYGQWTWMRRSNKRVDERWSDFWRFVADVGNPPRAGDFRLYRLDEEKPYGPNNFFWREKVYKKKGSEKQKEYQRRAMKEFRANNPEYFRNKDLVRKFGITLEQYDAMLEEQNGVCAICGNKNTVIDNRTGKVRMLAVDHCHRSGHVRKLLCQQCNQGLGNFRDSPRLLRAAADYLTPINNTSYTVVMPPLDFLK